MTLTFAELLALRRLRYSLDTIQRESGVECWGGGGWRRSDEARDAEEMLAVIDKVIAAAKAVPTPQKTL